MVTSDDETGGELQHVAGGVREEDKIATTFLNNEGKKQRDSKTTKEA